MYETKRLILRNWKNKDTVPFIKMNQDLKVMEFFPALSSLEETTQNINEFKHSIKECGYGMFACELKENRQFIGFVGLTNVPSPWVAAINKSYGIQINPKSYIEVGWRIAYQYWGQGLAVEAAHKCLSVGFDDFGLSEIISFTASINKRSERVMQKLGMKRDFAHNFYHPTLAPKHPLALYILYRMSKIDFECSK